MCDRLMLPLTEPPDLLRRFVATPHEKLLKSGDLLLLVRTNAERLLRAAGAAADDEVRRAEWTIVADADMPSELEDALVVHSATTSFLSFGRACYVAVDHEKEEITGFISAGISDDVWMGVVLPAVADVCREAPGAKKLAAEHRR